MLLPMVRIMSPDSVSIPELAHDACADAADSPPPTTPVDEFVDRLLEKAVAHEATHHRCLVRFGEGGYGARSSDFARRESSTPRCPLPQRPL